MFSRDLLIRHPERDTDSFTLYIKGSILLSRIKQFNLRFKTMRHLRDPSAAFVPPDSSGVQSTDLGLSALADNVQDDPRRSAGFIELDTLAISFRSSFPHHLRNPMPDGVVESHLYTACLISQM